MKPLPSYLFLLLSLSTLSACTSPTRTAPTLTASTDASQSTAAKRGILEEAGDTTWRVVTAPARLIPSKKPDTTEAPETYAPPVVTINGRSWANDPPATQPAR